MRQTRGAASSGAWGARERTIGTMDLLTDNSIIVPELSVSNRNVSPPKWGNVALFELHVTPVTPASHRTTYTTYIIQLIHKLYSVV